ncbi:hypothetical protein QN277_027311 [Acacia crassicarpa]|uniref:Alpha/beta hydrolase fold-3 domain-containing protein n=1 Tax=Acacia crassicarpa TaxID=499986 RepID=A0AAE1K7T0_9FABA|nr:hypothetical protein QN277_027311 [Acacia crassicarpa]
MTSTNSATSTATKEIETEFPNLIRVYKDGTVERLFGSPIVPPSLHDSDTGVSSKDVVISDHPSISARLYLPKFAQSEEQKKLPILVYFHGGGFCLESAFSFLDQRYLNLIASKANVIAVSVEYRLAPEHHLPAALEDCWESLKWVSSHSTPTNAGEPWLINHGDFNRIYLGGDSAGGTIVHNIAMRSGTEDLPGCVKLAGGFLSCPYFWGSKPVGSETEEGHEQSLPLLLWNFVYPSAPGGVDNPTINPTAEGAPSLASIGCSKLLVFVCGKDQLRDRGALYYEAVKNSGWNGEVEGEDHCFHIFTPETDNAKRVFDRFASLLV